MRRRWALLPVLCAAALAQDAEDSLDEESIALDLAAARRLAEALPPKGLATKELLKKLAVDPDSLDDFENERDLGYGLRRTCGHLGGGYGSFWFTIASHGDRVAGIEVAYPILKDEKELEARLKPILGDGFRRERRSEHEDHLRYRWVDEDAWARLHAAVAEKLGKPEPDEVPADLRDAFGKLTDPLALLQYGWIFGEGGDPAAGREELERILKSGNAALLRNVMRGPNPEGRIFAAEALLRMEHDGRKLTADERKLLDALRALPVEVTCVAGCLVDRRPGAEALADGVKEATEPPPPEEDE